VKIHPIPSAAEEDYLKFLYLLGGQTPDGRVRTRQLASELGVACPSVTKMLKRMAERGFVSYQRYQGATLTSHGERSARATLHHHCLWEMYLHHQFGMSWDAAHHEAERLEHVLSNQLGDRIATHLRSARHSLEDAAPPEVLKLVAIERDRSASDRSQAGEIR